MKSFHLCTHLMEHYCSHISLTERQRFPEVKTCAQAHGVNQGQSWDSKPRPGLSSQEGKQGLKALGPEVPYWQGWVFLPGSQTQDSNPKSQTSFSRIWVTMSGFFTN